LDKINSHRVFLDKTNINSFSIVPIAYLESQINNQIYDTKLILPHPLNLFKKEERASSAWIFKSLTLWAILIHITKMLLRRSERLSKMKIYLIPDSREIAKYRLLDIPGLTFLDLISFSQDLFIMSRCGALYSK